MAAINAFLRTSRSHVSAPRRSSPPKAPSHPHPPPTVHVVLGNESADLDSTACALSLAYLRHSQQSQLHWVPVINIPRVDFSLRTDVVWLMNSLGVDSSLLTFADEIDMPSLMKEKRLQISLVDHNRLAAHQEGLGAAVSECIDHHADESLYAATMKYKRVEVVGSCSSLITEEYVKSHSQGLITPELAKLLIAPILMDTYNFDPKTTRATAKDREMAAVLRGVVPGFGTDDLFHTLWHEKTSLARLSSVDLLRRDYKEFEFGAGKIGAASMPNALATCFERSDFIAEARRYMAERGLLFLLVNTAFSLPDGSLGRELLVCSGQGTQAALVARLLHHLERSELKLTPHTAAPTDERMRVYVQHNISASRKQLIPIVSAFFSSL